MQDYRVNKVENFDQFSTQIGKYVVRAEDFPNANNLPCAQRPIKRAIFEKYTHQARMYPQKSTITYAEMLVGFQFQFNNILSRTSFQQG